MNAFFFLEKIQKVYYYMYIICERKFKCILDIKNRHTAL